MSNLPVLYQGPPATQTPSRVPAIVPQQVILRPGPATRESTYDPSFEPTVAAKGSKLLGGFLAYVDRTLDKFRAKEHVIERTARMLVMVPAHNEEDTIAGVIEHILKQTRKPDRVVIIADNCTDDTIKIATRYIREARNNGIDLQVMETVGNTDRKVGALTQGWQRHAHEFDFLAGVDGDTLLMPSCLNDLEEELVRNPSAGGIMARYTFDQDVGRTMLAKNLVRLQRHEFASWNAEHGYRNRRTYVLGGQATLFSVRSLADVQAQYRRNSPWVPTTQVEDQELTWRMKELNMQPLVSNTARALAGPMVTAKSLWAQRQKWDQGQARLLLADGLTEHTRYPWKMQFRMMLDLVTRVSFLFLLLCSLGAGKFEWNPLWLVPPALSILLNIKVAMKMPNRKAMDVVTAALFLPCELYLMFRLTSMTTAWMKVLGGSQRDGWSAQYAAERGHGNSGLAKFLMALLVLFFAAYGAAVGWTHLESDIQDQVLITGWNVLKIITILCCVDMVWKLVRPSKGFRP
jgi:biofilm PGA synthesis N-glycosyltransferase PgaC